jgi:hypothetical protein
MTSDDRWLGPALEELAARADLRSTPLASSVRIQRRRTRHRRQLAVGAVVPLVVVVVAAVVSGGAATSSKHGKTSLAIDKGKLTTADLVPAAGVTVAPPAGFLAAVSQGRQATTVADFANAGLRLDAVPLNLQPAVSAASAYAQCATNPAAKCDSDHAPTMTFALATSDVGGQVQADGSVKRALNQTPTWVLYWSDLTCYAISGGPIGPGSTPAPSTPQPCTKVAVVDATTGAYLWTEQDIPKG